MRALMNVGRQKIFSYRRAFTTTLSGGTGFAKVLKAEVVVASGASVLSQRYLAKQSEMI
jgi:hypothetical protein